LAGKGHCSVKFNPNDILKIQNRASISRLLAEIKSESEVKARIVKRYSPREAILEIRGRRIKTEFTSTLPEKSEVTLKLINRDSGTYLFKLVDPAIKSEIISILENISFLDQDELGSLNLSVLKKFFDRDLKDLGTLNLLLIERKDLIKLSHETLSFLRYLKSSGLNSPALNMLSLISANSRQEIQLLVILLSFTGSLGNINQRYFREKEIDTSRLISDIFEMIDDSVDERDKNEILRKLIDLLSEKDNLRGEFTAGELFFFDEDAEKKINYLSSKKSWLFSLNLSNIGIIDIFAREISGTFEITLFAENDAIINLLKSSHNRLESILKTEGIKTSIKYQNRGNIVDKLERIAAKYYSESSIDVKA
jgi:hypothetical protein